MKIPKTVKCNPNPTRRSAISESQQNAEEFLEKKRNSKLRLEIETGAENRRKLPKNS